MNLAFVGMGSIGKRHFRNVRAYLEQAGTPYSVDLYRSGRGGGLDGDISKSVREEFPLDSGVSREYDAVFITNPTSMHYETLRQFAHAAKAAFIEKPVFDTPEAALGGAVSSERRDLLCGLSSAVSPGDCVRPAEYPAGADLRRQGDLLQLSAGLAPGDRLPPLLQRPPGYGRRRRY